MPASSRAPLRISSRSRSAISRRVQLTRWPLFEGVGLLQRSTVAAPDRAA
jgi:hypothetical protein